MELRPFVPLAESPAGGAHRRPNQIVAPTLAMPATPPTTAQKRINRCRKLIVLVLCRQPVDDLAAIDVSAFEAVHIRAVTGAKMKQVSAHVGRAHFLEFGSLDLG
jgi:hypothetical protein